MKPLCYIQYLFFLSTAVFQIELYCLYIIIKYGKQSHSLHLYAKSYNGQLEKVNRLKSKCCDIEIMEMLRRIHRANGKSINGSSRQKDIPPPYKPF